MHMQEDGAKRKHELWAVRVNSSRNSRANNRPSNSRLLLTTWSLLPDIVLWT